MLQSKPSKIGGSKHWVENLLVKCQKKACIVSAKIVDFISNYGNYCDAVSNVANIMAINSVSPRVWLGILVVNWGTTCHGVSQKKVSSGQNLTCSND